MQDPVSILIVDDRPENLLALEAVLEPLGERVVRARSGEEALRAVLKEDFAVILLDVRMPGMDGVETAQLIRSRERNADTPLIFVTGNDAEKLRMGRGYAAGAVDYILKPIDPEILRSKVAVFIQLHRKNVEVERQAHEIHRMRERERVEQARRESERRFRAMADAAPILIGVSDAHGGIQYLNTGWTEFTGRSEAEELGDGWLEAVHPEDREPLRRQIGEAMADQKALQTEFRLRRRDGVWRWMLLSAVPRADLDGGFAGFVGTCVDLTERIEMQQELEELNSTLEQRAAERSAVAEQRAELLRIMASELTQAEQRERRRIAQMLHDELQQLLVAAMLRVGAISSRLDDEEARKAMQQLRELLQQSVDTSRSLTVELSPPILYDGGLEAALLWLARQMQEKHALEVTCDIDFAVEPAVDTYGVLLFQSVRELLFNVIKHSSVDTARVIGRTGEARIRITVVDSGGGFDPAEVEGRRDDGGSGFGLFSIRERLEVLGGRLEIDSRPGDGARITLVAPLELRRADTVSEPALVAGSPRRAPMRSIESDRIRVLLADDHEMLREGLAGLLRQQEDLEVVGEAWDGASAIEMVRERHPDVVVMDISMPGINGVDATRQILREAPGTRVIGLSMHEVADMGPAILKAGAELFLSKDGPSDALISAIRGGA